MSFDAIFVVCIVVVMIFALIKDRQRPGMILFSAAVVFLCAGILKPKEMLEGFSNKGMITVALLYLVSEGVRRSGFLEVVLKKILPGGKVSVRRVLRSMLPSVAFISAFLNNTPIVVIFAPMIKRWAEQRKMPASKFLIPLSYATILGGACTLIGTSTNLVVDGLIIDAGYEGFTMFELGKVGVFIAVAGLLYIYVFSPLLLPKGRRAEDNGGEEMPKGMLNRVEVVLGARFPAIGRRVSDYDFKDKFAASVIEIRREGKTILMHDMRHIRFREGDTLVLATDENFMKSWGESSFFLLATDGREPEPKLSLWKRRTSITLLVLMIIGATIGELPMTKAAFPKVNLDMFFFAAVVTVAMSWMNIFPARKYTKFISWDIVITIASAFAISKAMMNSGMADAIAQLAISLSHNFGPYVLLAFIFIVTDCFTEVMTNNAAAALAFPISLSIAGQLGVSPTPFFVCICMAASASFSTPIGYQTNLIVQGIGGYKFSDFVRVGLPLNLIALILSVTLIPVFFPF